MRVSNRNLAMFFTTLLVVLALVGGTWTTTLGAPLPQGTLPGGGTATATPDHNPERTATPTSRVNPPVQPPSGPVPQIFIVSVNPDNTVTIRTINFPKGTDFDVLMNYYGTLGVGGKVVTTVNSGAGGELNWTFNIPDFLKGQKRIAIRLQSKNGYFAFNWFWNQASGSQGKPAATSASPSATKVPAPKVCGVTFPTIFIMAVEQDKSVTIRAFNMPTSQKFDVLLNYNGTLGINGDKVGTADSDGGGSLVYTFNIPAKYQGQERVAIRLQSASSGAYAYNWFWNHTVSTSISAPASGSVTCLPAGVVPSFSIKSVVKDSKVTVNAVNLPKNDVFLVAINTYGTPGIGVTTALINTGGGGSQELTFNVPDAIKGNPRFSIVMISPTSGYYAYNWFWNNNAN